MADYDRFGLWSHDGVQFSRAGTLMATAQVLTEQAPAGWFADELAAIVKIETQDALRKLVAAGRLARVRRGGRFLYCSSAPAERQRQLRAREVMLAEGPQPQAVREDDQVKRATGLLISLLDERQRRLYAGLESLRHGRGGDNLVAAWLGMAPATVARGRQQLLSGDFEAGRIRKPGGGRKPVEKKTTGSAT